MKSKHTGDLAPASNRVPLGDSHRQYVALKAPIDEAVHRVLDSGCYLRGEETSSFEHEFAAFCGAKHAVACANGTDAITLALMGLGIEAGAEVIVPAMTAVPTATGVIQARACPKLADIDPQTGLVTAETLARVISPKTRALVVVHLYGQSCEMRPILELARQNSLRVIEDAAQAHGATDGKNRLGIESDAVTYSFYPSKNMGAFGDAGAVTTDDAALAEKCVRAREYGQTRRYDHAEYGINSRMDEIQAAILRVKLLHLASGNARRRAIADRYDDVLRGSAIRPLRNAQGEGHVRHLYVVTSERAGDVSRELNHRGVDTSVHYPKSLNEQLGLPRMEGQWQQASRFARSIVTLPLFPELTEDEILRVVRALQEVRGG